MNILKRLLVLAMLVFSACLLVYPFHVLSLNTTKAILLIAGAGGMATTLALLSIKQRTIQHQRTGRTPAKSTSQVPQSIEHNQFVTNFSHEIRTPLTGIMGMTELLLELNLDKQAKAYAMAIQRSSQMMLLLVNNTLEMTRLRTGHLVLEEAPVNIRALVNEVHQLLAIQASSKHLNWFVRTSEDMPDLITGDALRIKQILLNLSYNAIKFTPQGGVGIDADYMNGQLRFRIFDTGPGIPTTNRKHLFERFNQTHQSQQKQGTGLGLPICRDLIEHMQGKIKLVSTEGSGSQFFVYLPLAPHPSSTRPKATLTHTSTIKTRLLLVSNDQNLYQQLQQLLTGSAFHLHNAPHILTALNQLQSNHFQLVLIDQKLPDKQQTHLVGYLDHLLRSPAFAIIETPGKQSPTFNTRSCKKIHLPINRRDLVKILIKISKNT